VGLFQPIGGLGRLHEVHRWLNMYVSGIARCAQLAREAASTIAHR